MMKILNKMKLVTGFIVIILFYIHVIINTLLIAGKIKWHPFNEISGIVLCVLMGIHIFISVLCFRDKDTRKSKFYILKWITGVIILLTMIFHGRDYMKEINFLCIHFNKGIAAAMIESIFLVMCTLHIRISLGNICTQLELSDKNKKIVGGIGCGIATITILIPLIFIWKYFMI